MSPSPHRRRGACDRLAPARQPGHQRASHHRRKEWVRSVARRTSTGSHWSVSSDAAVKLMTQVFDDAVDARHELGRATTRYCRLRSTVVVARSHEQAAAWIGVPGASVGAHRPCTTHLRISAECEPPFLYWISGLVSDGPIIHYPGRSLAESNDKRPALGLVQPRARSGGAGFVVKPRRLTP